MDSTEQTVLVQMSADLDAMFKKMGSETRQKEIDQHASIMKFTQQIGAKQLQLIQNQQGRKTEPPVVDGKWPSPQSVKQANQQFLPFTKFSKDKESEIDATCQELLELNAQMMEGLEKCFLNKTETVDESETTET